MPSCARIDIYYLHPSNTTALILIDGNTYIQFVRVRYIYICDYLKLVVQSWNEWYVDVMKSKATHANPLQCCSVFNLLGLELELGSVDF